LPLIKDILKNQLFKVSSLNGLSVVTRVAGGLLASKITAVFIGPAGMALSGSFRNFLSSLDAFSTLGMQNGIIKYTAQYEHEQQKLYEWLATAFIAIGLAAVLFTLILVLPAAWWSRVVFNGDVHFSWLFRLTGLTLPLYAGGLIFMALLNGLGRYNNVIWINIISYAIGVVITAILIYYNGLSGAFIGLLCTPFLICFQSAFIAYRLTGFAFMHFKYFRLSNLKNLFSYSLMSVVTAVLGSVIYISLRNMLISHEGGNVAGHWEGINRISFFYMMFLTTLLNVYFLPKLSKATTNVEIKNIIRGYYKFVVPLFAIGLLLVYVFRKFIISVTLSGDFLPMEKLFAWQLIGDFLRVCSLILGQMFFSHKLTRAFIAAATLSFAIFYISGKLLINTYGAEGAVMAHAFTSLTSLIVLSVYFRKKVF
jgi:O-antigen/teichoic acid export membrane protein